MTTYIITDRMGTSIGKQRAGTGSRAIRLFAKKNGSSATQLRAYPLDTWIDMHPGVAV